MPSYDLTVVDALGARSRRLMDAQDKEAIARALRREGLTLICARENRTLATEQLFQRRHKRAVLQATSSLAALLSAGVPLPRALQCTANASAAVLRSVLHDLHESVRRGESLAEALRSRPAIFSHLYIGVIAAGERTGDLPGAFTRLASHLEAQQAMRARIISAATYPVVLAAAGLTTVLLLLVIVLPQFAAMLLDAGVQLPASTSLLLALGNALHTHLVVIVSGTVVCGLLVHYVTRGNAGHRVVSRALLAFPLTAPLRKRVLGARFSALMHVLLAGNAPLLNALEITAEGVSDDSATRDIQAVRASVRQGVPLAASLRNCSVFPLMLHDLVEIGEQSSQLPTFFGRASEILAAEVENLLRRMVALLEPAMVIVIGAFVGFVALSLLQAIYGLNTAAVR